MMRLEGSSTRSSDVRAASPAALCAMCEQVIEETRRISLESYEDAAVPVGELLDQVRRGGERALELLGLALDRYDGEPTPSLDGLEIEGEARFAAEIERRLDRSVNPERITGVAFVARIGLRDRLSSLSRAEGMDDRCDVLHLCDRVIREVARSLRALAATIREYEALPPGIDYRALEVERAREIRRAYAAFHREVDAEPPASEAEVARRIRLAGVSIAKLLGRTVGLGVRPRDRFALVRIRKRISAWLRAAVSDGGAPLEDAERILGDLAGTARLMLEINRRQEIVEHDRAALADAEALSERDPKAMLARLEGVRGRDAELDVLIQERAARLPADWQRAIRRALAPLEPPPPSVAPPAPAAADMEWAFKTSRPPPPPSEPAGDVDNDEAPITERSPGA